MQSIRPVLKQFRLGRRSSSSGSVFLGAVQGFWERMSSLGGLMGMLRRARADGREPLFISLADVHPDRKLPALSPIKITGPYSTYHELRKTHLDLLSEDFRRALSEQINEIRGNPKLLESTFHYVVTGDRVMLTQKYGRRGRHQIGVKMSFDSNKYRHVRWDEEKRFLSGNLVFLSKDGMKTFHVGLVHDSHPHFLRRGHVVIKMISGTDGKYFQMLDQQSFVGSTYHLVESAVFYFPYLHVTNALREDRDSRLFFEEIVRGQPSKPPMYMSALSYVEQVHFDLLRDSLIQGLNESQANAFKSVLKHRVALVQGPPGTGKTYLGCKVAEFFVSLKKKCPSLFSGPLLVVTTTNHAVDEFLSRCLVFTDKLVHAYSDKHTRSHHGALQEKYDEDPTHDGKGAIMRRADIVAMTTTRAAYVRSTLDDLEIKIVIVEEAAEALEAYVLASIPQNIQHLIQIGDHKQLQPSCSHHALASSHNLNLSLFERLLNNGLECVMLNEQRRMRPSIKKLVENIYPNLTNHPCTEERPRVKGVDLEVPVFFINKTEPEKQEGKSYSNVEEAAMAAELAAYLLRQGYDVGKITVLTTYKRQLSLVLKNLRRIGDGAQNIRATCVDNFQGEENDIIILSLVRSNASGAIGFLQKENRACVALTRAKTGFFILGNVSCLTASGSTTWQHVKDELSCAGRLGPALPLVCPHGRKFLGVSAADIREAGEGCAVCRLDTALSEAEKLTQKVAIELEKTAKALVAVTRDVDNMLLDQEARDAAKNAMEAELVKKTRLVDELSARRLEEEELRKKCRTAAALLERGRIDVATETVESLEEKVKGYQAELLPEVLGRLSVA